MSSGSEGSWFQWTPANADSVAYEDIRQAIAEFESLDTEAGRAAGTWLREEALLNYPSTVTYVLLSERRIDGYFAIASGSVTLTQGHRKGLGTALGPEQRPYAVSPTQGASLIAWLARHKDGKAPGHQILFYALSIALKVSRLQGTPLVVLDPYDDDLAELWKTRYGFRRSRTPGGNDVRLWVPLHPK